MQAKYFDIKGSENKMISVKVGTMYVLGPVYTELAHDHERDHCDFPRNFPLERSHEPAFIQNAVIRVVTVAPCAAMHNLMKTAIRFHAFFVFSTSLKPRRPLSYKIGCFSTSTISSSVLPDMLSTGALQSQFFFTRTASHLDRVTQNKRTDWLTRNSSCGHRLRIRSGGNLCDLLHLPISSRVRDRLWYKRDSYKLLIRNPMRTPCSRSWSWSRSV